MITNQEKLCMHNIRIVKKKLNLKNGRGKSSSLGESNEKLKICFEYNGCFFFHDNIYINIKLFKIMIIVIIILFIQYNSQYVLYINVNIAETSHTNWTEIE